MRLAPGSARDIAVGFVAPPQLRTTPLPFVAPLPVAWRRVRKGRAIAYKLDVYHDESPTYVLDNGTVRVVISADAGARSFFFEDDRSQVNAFTTVGSLRDDVQQRPPPSSRDYIAAYTHPMPAGTFNRPYKCRIESSGGRAQLSCTYTAPDLGAAPVQFRKTIVLDPGARAFYAELWASAPAMSLDGPTLRIAYPANTDTWIKFAFDAAPMPIAGPPD
jgi:hypothetical protein